jgi:hypothetical protein
MRALSMRELRLWAAAAAGPAVAAAFCTLAALRRRRSLHPAGIGYQGWLQVDDEAPARRGVPLFQPGAAHPAVLRFSRGAGLPEPLPDALGVAIKLPDAHGPGADQDLLLTSSTDRPLLRRLLFPARSFLHGSFSTALPYDLDGERVVLLLVPAPSGSGRSPRGVARGGALAELRAAAAGPGFELRTAGTLGPSQWLATLTVGQPLPAEQTQALRFNPWTTGPGIRPSGRLNLLRDARDPAPLRYVGVRLADSEPVDGPPSSAHDEQNRGRRTISRPCGPGAHSRAFQKTRLRLRRQSHISTAGPAHPAWLALVLCGCSPPPTWLPRPPERTPHHAIRRLLHGKHPPGWCRLTSFGSCGRLANHHERRHGP